MLRTDLHLLAVEFELESELESLSQELVQKINPKQRRERMRGGSIHRLTEACTIDNWTLQFRLGLSLAFFIVNYFDSYWLS